MLSTIKKALGGEKCSQLQSKVLGGEAYSQLQRKVLGCEETYSTSEKDAGQ